MGWNWCCCKYSIVKLNSSGTVVWKIDTGDTVTRVKVDNLGFVYALSAITGKIRKFNATTASSVWTVTDALIPANNSPDAAFSVCGPDNKLYHVIRSAGLYFLKARDTGAGALSWISANSFPSLPTGLASISTGALSGLWFGDDDTQRVRAPNVATGVDQWAAKAPAPMGGRKIYQDANSPGIVGYKSWAMDSVAGTRFQHFDAGGGVLTTFTDGGVGDVLGFCADISANMYFLNSSIPAQNVRSVKQNGATVTVRWNFASGHGPGLDIAIDHGELNVFPVCFGGGNPGAVFKLNAATGAEVWHYSRILGHGFYGVDVDASGNVYVCGESAQD